MYQSETKKGHNLVEIEPHDGTGIMTIKIDTDALKCGVVPDVIIGTTVTWHLEAMCRAVYAQTLNFYNERKKEDE